MNKIFDIIIIGAGPAGLSAAEYALKDKSKPTVLLIDKSIPWEKPIACAEGVWTEMFENAFGKKNEWIRLYISSVVLISANGSSISHTAKNAGLIINRPKMQQDMAENIKKLGGEILLNCKISNIATENDSLRKVVTQDGSFFLSKTIIDASGPISCFGKNQKISYKPLDLEPAYFAIAENVNIDNDKIYIHLSSSMAPGGYAWAFPRENRNANIGIVVAKEYSSKINIKQNLNMFIKKYFPDAKILYYHAGCIPCAKKLGTIAYNKLIKAGDAASMVNPITRAGIIEAVYSGRLAARCALDILKATSQKQIDIAYKNYHKNWYNLLGKKHEKLWRVKNAFFKIPDKDYDNAFYTLSQIPSNKRTISKIIRISLGRFPNLIWAMRHLI
jgi:digeranylgeranylglycerophospholipid reductase